MKIKRIAAFLVLLCLIIGMLPVQTHAADIIVDDTCTACGDPCAHTGGSYSASGATITESCADCGATVGTATLSAAGKTYDGIAVTATVSATDTLKDRTWTIHYCCDGGCTHAGDHTATITLNGVTAKEAFTIAEKPITDAAVTVDPNADLTYTASAITPGVTVTLDGKTLAADDYDISYSNHTHTGAATVTVSGKGNYTGAVTTHFPIVGAALSDFTYSLDTAAKTVTLTKYIGSGKTVVVPNIYEIGGEVYDVVLDSATVFRGNTVITSVLLDNAVSFKDHSMSYLFAECTKLTDIRMPGLDTTAVTDMSYLFYYCTGLKHLDVSDLDTQNVTTLRSTFSYCTKLQSLTGYENWNTSSVTDMYQTFNRVFSATNSSGSLATAVIDISAWDLDQVKNTGWCFQLCYANEILLPDNLAVISAGFMNHAAKVTGSTYTIPKGVQKIGYAHTIYDFATNDFVEFTVANGNTNYKTVDGILYSMDGTEMLAIPRNKPFVDNVYEIPEGITFLAELSFSRNYNIHKIILPDSYVIEQNVEVYDEDYIVFEDKGNLNVGNSLSIAIYCYTGITAYEVKATNPNYVSVDGIIYSKDMTQVVAIPTRYDRIIHIPEGVTTWNKQAMWNDKEVPDQYGNIVVDNLQAACGGIHIPSTLIAIEEEQHGMMNRLKYKFADSFTITVDANNPVYYVDGEGYLRIRTDLTDAQIQLTLPAEGYAYDGSEKKPDVSVSLNETALLENTDFTVSYTANVNAGTATVTVTGMSAYVGTASTTFPIAPMPVTELEATLGTYDSVYNGSEKRPGVTSVRVDNKTLTAGTDYEVTWSDNRLVGTATVIITFKGNYTGTQEVTFEITPKVVTAPAFDGVDTAYIYTGSAIAPAFTLKDDQGNVIPASEYAVSYKDNTDVGTATITVTDVAGGNYTVSGSMTFQIIVHAHDWTYTASGNVITALCNGAIGTCPVENAAVTITLNAPADLRYDGTAKSVTVTQTPVDIFDLPAVVYTGDCTGTGEHTATLTYGEKTATLTFAITCQHSYEAGKYTWNADNTLCVVTGTCDCGSEVTATVAVTAKQTKEPTCEDIGKITCTASFEETWAGMQVKILDIPAKDHSYTSAVTAPTCTEKGYTTYTCTECGDSYVDSYVPATGHAYRNGICTGCDAEHPNLAAFEGKTISILGDSISTFAGVSNDASTNSTLSGGWIYYNEGTLGISRKDTWWQQTIDTLDMELQVNNSWSGSCIFTTRAGTVGAYVDRSVQLHDNTGAKPDVIAVYLGTNDFCNFKGTLGSAADIDYSALITENAGTYSYSTPTTAAEAYAIMLHKMTVRYPHADIYCFTLLPQINLSSANVQLLEQFNETIKAVAAEFDAEVVDLYSDSGIKADAQFQNYITDNSLHPGPLGMDAISELFIQELLDRGAPEGCTHSYQSQVTAPTCTEQGYTTYTCTACGHSYVDSYVPVTAHNYDRIVCTVCGEKYPEELADLDDSFVVTMTPENYLTISNPVMEKLSCAPSLVAYGDGNFAVSYLADDVNTVETESSTTIVCRLALYNIADPAHGIYIDIATAGQTIGDVTIGNNAPYEPNLLKLSDSELLIFFNVRDTSGRYVYYSAKFDTTTNTVTSYQPLTLDGRNWTPANIATSYNAIADNTISSSGPAGSMVFTSKFIQHDGYYYGFCGGICKGFSGILVRSTDGINWTSVMVPEALNEMEGVIECGFQILDDCIYFCMRDISSGVYHSSYKFSTKEQLVKTTEITSLTTSKPCTFIQDGKMYVIVNKATGDDNTVGRRNTAQFYKVDPETCGLTLVRQVFCADGCAYHTVENFNGTNYWCFHTDARRINPYSQGRSNLAFLKIPTLVERQADNTDGVLDLADYEHMYANGCITVAANVWQTGAGVPNMHYQIPLVEYSGFDSVTITANSNNKCYIAFFTSLMTKAGGIAYADGWTEQLIMEPGTTAVLNIPEDAAYLYILNNNAAGANLLPESVIFSKTETEQHTHIYTSSITHPTCTEQGYTTHTCTECGDSYVSDYTDCRPLNILMIGNSFSWDAADFWYDMQESMTYSAMKSMLAEPYDIHFAVMYKGSATLAYHATCAKKNTSNYTYTEIGPETGYVWTPASGKNATNSILQRLEQRDWDIIVIQSYQHEADNTAPRSTYTGGDAEFTSPADSIPYLLDYFADHEPGAQVYYYMPWASTKFYGNDGTDAGFLDMAAHTKENVVSYTGNVSGTRFAGIVPVGTGIQNARTTYLDELRYSSGTGSTVLLKDPQNGLQYDNQHLSFGIGRYIASIIVAESLIPQEMRKDHYVWPSIKESPSVGTLPQEYMTIAQLAAKKAMEQPYQLTTLSGYEKDLAERIREAIEQDDFTSDSIADETALKAHVEAIVSGHLKDTGASESTIAINSFTLDNGTVQNLDATVTLRIGYTSCTAQISVVDGTPHHFGQWVHVTTPTKDTPGVDQRTCSLCGFTETREVLGSWQKFCLEDHLQALPETFCCGTNLWQLLQPESVMIDHLGNWVSAGATVYSVTIPVNAGDRIYANSFDQTDSRKGIQVSFIDAYGILKTTFSSETYTEFHVNGGYLIAPEGAIAVNIPVWNNSDDNEIYILNRDHSFDSACDATCNTCGYGQTITHSYRTIWDTDLNYHWHECNICGHRKDVTAHSWKPVTCTTPATCTGCGMTDGSAGGHEWAYATCTAPATCENCGATEGSAKGHSWKSATCTTPKTCTTCGANEGNAKGHSWKSATCTTPKTCTTCGATEGIANGHNWTAATCTAPKTCTTCGANEGNAKGHSWKSATCTTAKICTTCGTTEGATKGHGWKAATCTTPKTCTACGATEGIANGHSWKAATCAKPKTCSTCGATSGKPVAHIYSDGLDGTCNVCGIHRETTEQRNVMHMFRMYDPNSGEHFYTGSTVERENLVAAGWHYEGVGFTFSMTTGAPVYRLYDPVYGEHLYTMDEAEKAALMAAGWNLEGIAFNSAYDTEVPQYRLHNPNAKRGAYHFTASIEERDFLISLGWEYQGIGFYSSWK